MTDLKPCPEMPDEIWACIDHGYNHWVDAYPVWGGSTKYTRADRLMVAVEALRHIKESTKQPYLADMAGEALAKLEDENV